MSPKLRWDCFKEEDLRKNLFENYFTISDKICFLYMLKEINDIEFQTMFNNHIDFLRDNKDSGIPNLILLAYREKQIAFPTAEILLKRFEEKETLKYYINLLRKLQNERLNHDGI